MQNRSRRLKIIIIIILFIDSGLINYGSCAPRKSQWHNNQQKVKRSASFMNYLSSMIYRTSFNYPDLSWNFYESQPPQPEPNRYEANFIQYLGDPGNNVPDGNYINWPERDEKKIIYFHAPPKDVPNTMTNVERDNSLMLENDCHYDINSVESDTNWNFPQQGLDESIFHDFYLIPEDNDFNKGHTLETTVKPVEQSVQARNKDDEENTPNISIFNCFSNPDQKEFLEKVLSDNIDEYMVLFIKKNPFLGKPEKESKTEKPHANSQTRRKNTISSYVENQPDISIEDEKKPIANAETSDTNIALGIRNRPQKESSATINTSIVSSHVTNRKEHDITLNQNIEETIRETSRVITKKEDDKISDQDIEEIINIVNLKASAASTVSPPSSVKDQDIKRPKIPIIEENGDNFSTESQKELNKVIINIPTEDTSSDIQTVQNVENETKIETADQTKKEENLSNDELKAIIIDNPENDADIGVATENKLQTTEEGFNTNLETKQEIPIENLAGQHKEDSIDDITSTASNNDPTISKEVHISTVASQIENVQSQTADISEGSLSPKETQVTKDSYPQLDDSIAPVTSANKEDDTQKLTAVEKTASQEVIGLLESPSEEIKPDSISIVSTNTADNAESLPSE